MTATLTEDVFSSAKKGIQYAKKGDQVTITADFANVVIVKDKNGKKFPVKKDQLTYEKEV